LAVGERVDPMFEAEIKQVGAFTVAYEVMHGSFDQMPGGYQTLYEWVARQGFQPAGMPHAVYLTMPDQAPESEWVWELWAPVGGDPATAEPAAEGCGVKRIPAQEVASAMHRGPYEAVAATYEHLFSWLTEHGYEIDGPPRELYYSDPETVAPADYLTEVQIPVTSQSGDPK
jgi:effector-binding domain-containing protein